MERTKKLYKKYKWQKEKNIICQLLEECDIETADDIQDALKYPLGWQLKTVYQAPNEQKTLATLEHVTEKLTPKHSNFMNRWKNNWDTIRSFFKFSAEVKKIIYMTNAIESLNSTYRN